MDETRIKVKGVLKYLYRAVDDTQQSLMRKACHSFFCIVKWEVTSSEEECQWHSISVIGVTQPFESAYQDVNLRNSHSVTKDRNRPEADACVAA
jgi:hypothetical protein